MAGGFHIYHEAARALWELKTSRLETMAREDADAARRRAAALTLRLKADFVTPQERGDERSSINKLASALLEDPGFNMDLALGMGRSAPMRSAPVLFQAGITRPSGRSRVMWVAITAAVILLVMDVLATAGVPVPTPIGELIDHFSGSDESPLDPGPPSQESRSGGGRRPQVGTDAAAHAKPEPRATIMFERESLRDKAKKDQDTSPDRARENDRRAQGREEHQAKGREANQAQGREEHQAKGREANQAQGRDAHQAQGRDKQRKIAPGHRKLARAKDLRE